MKKPFSNSNAVFKSNSGFQTQMRMETVSMKRHFPILFQAIQNRISSALHAYEEDHSMTDDAILEQMLQFKFLSDITALQQYINDKEFRQKLQKEVTTVLVVGASNAATKRTTLLNGILNALEKVSFVYLFRQYELVKIYSEKC